VDLEAPLVEHLQETAHRTDGRVLKNVLVELVYVPLLQEAQTCVTRLREYAVEAKDYSLGSHTASKV
jgi:hypothetical protein